MLSGGAAAISSDFEATNEAIRVEYCQILHERLTARAKQRVALEADEAKDLVYAEEAEVWRRFGYVSMFEYMERELHYSRHAANERLRVANELFYLPRLAEQFKSGEMPFSVLRELTRVAVPENEEVWLERAKGKTATQVQTLVSGLRKGADPDDETDPRLMKYRLTFEVDAETFALWQAQRTKLDDDAGERVSDSALIYTAARAMAEGGEGLSAPCLHAVTTCKACMRSTLVANGLEVPLDEATAERMLCDSVEIGDLESDEITRAKAAIPESTRRKVLIRDLFACAVPGCRSKRNLNCHHVQFRSEGGNNKPDNLLTLCWGHHQQLHEGRLRITGVAPDRLVFEFRCDGDGEPHRVMTSAVNENANCEEDNRSVPRGTDQYGGRNQDSCRVKITPLRIGSPG